MTQDKQNQITLAYKNLFVAIGEVKGIGAQARRRAVELNGKAVKSGQLENKHRGSVVAMSPMELGTNIQILIDAAFAAGKEIGQI